MTVVVNDTFTEASDTDLDAHTPDTGDGWTEEQNLSGAPVDERAIVVASSDRVMFLDGDGVTAHYSAQPNPTVTEYDVQITYQAITGGGTRAFGVIARWIDINNYYYAGNQGSGGPWKLWKKLTGTVTELGTFTGTPVAGDVLDFRVRDSGTRLEVFENTISIITSSDTSHTAAGKAGVSWGGDDSEIDDSWEADDFSVDQIAAAAADFPPVPSSEHTNVLLRM